MSSGVFVFYNSIRIMIVLLLPQSGSVFYQNSFPDDTEAEKDPC